MERTTPTLKQKRFAKKYVETGNATEAAVHAYPALASRDVAKSVAGENLAKPIVRREIEALLNANGVTVDKILSVHTRNMMQREHLPTSQRATESYEEMLGLKAATQAPAVNVAFFLNKTDD